MPFDLLPTEHGDRVKAVGMTRAGLLESALKGTFAAAGARFQEDGEEVTRSFAVHAADFDALLAALLEQALKLATDHGEAYQSVAFDLITVMDAKGSFVGKRADGRDEKRAEGRTQRRRRLGGRDRLRTLNAGPAP